MSLKPKERPFLNRRWSDNCRVIGPLLPARGLRDRAVAAERAHQIRDNRRGARRGARGQRPVLVLREERRPEVHAVDVHVLENDRLVLADIRHVQCHRPRQRHLHTAVPLDRRGQLALVLEHVQRRRGLVVSPPPSVCSCP